MGKLNVFAWHAFCSTERIFTIFAMPLLLTVLYLLIPLISQKGVIIKVRSAICQDLLSLYCVFFSPLLVPSRKSISKDNGCAKPGFVLQAGLRSGLSPSCERAAQTHVTAMHYANICIYTKCSCYFFIALLILPKWADSSAVGLLKVISVKQFFSKPPDNR